jgi:hypothetical protein
MNSNVRYTGIAVLKYEDKQQCVEITAQAKHKGKDCVVSAIYTFDEWKTVRSKAGVLVNKEMETYRISIPVNAVANARMWFAIKLSYSSPNGTCEVWDNNNGWNYELITDKLKRICLPSTPKPPPSTSTLTINTPKPPAAPLPNSDIFKPTNSIPPKPPSTLTNSHVQRHTPLIINTNPICFHTLPTSSRKTDKPPTPALSQNVFLLNDVPPTDKMSSLNIYDKPSKPEHTIIDTNMPLIIFSSKMRKYPHSSHIMPIADKKPELLVSRVSPSTALQILS